MKTNFKFILSFLLCIILLCTSATVLATDQNPDDSGDSVTYTDFSNVTYEFQGEGPSIVISGVTPNSESTYYFYLSGEQSDVPDIENDTIWDMLTNSTSGGLTTGAVTEVYERNYETFYLWIYESADVNNKQMVVEAQPINRIAQKTLGTRIHVTIDSISTNVIQSESISTGRNVTINYKIGKVTDNDILRSIQNGESDCLERLMEYAKNATNGVTGTLDLYDNPSIVSSLNIEHGAYYYGYFEIDDENGTYYPIEDIDLFQGVNNSAGIRMYDYLSEDFEWNLSDDVGDDDNNSNTIISNIIINDVGKNEDNTVSPDPIPQTGENVLIAIGVALIVVLGVVKYVDYKKMKDIK